MNRKAYSQTYNESKQSLRDAIKQFAQESPEKYAELKARALYELEHPQPRTVTRYPTHFSKLDIDTTIFRFRNGRKDYYVHTKDMFGSEHLYFETLINESEAEAVLTQRHPKYAERNERVTKVEPCTCPLCIQDSKQ